MKNKVTYKSVILIIFVLLFSVIFTWWMIEHTKKIMHNNLFNEVQIILNALNENKRKAMFGAHKPIEKQVYSDFNQLMSKIQKVTTF